MISHPAVTQAARRPGVLRLPLTVVPQKSGFCLFQWVGNISYGSLIPGKAVSGRCCFFLVALHCHGHQTCPSTSWCHCSSPAHCKQDSPIHPIQPSELCISGVSLFLIHHQLCVHAQDSPPWLPTALQSSCLTLSPSRAL